MLPPGVVAEAVVFRLAEAVDVRRGQPCCHLEEELGEDEAAQRRVEAAMDGQSDIGHRPSTRKKQPHKAPERV